MAYCGPRGIALDEFLSWSPASQDAAIEWAARESQRCTACGTWHDEWDLRNGVYPYHAHPQLCPGQKAVQDLQNSVRMRDAGHGVQVVLAHGPAADCPTCNPNR